MCKFSDGFSSCVTQKTQRMKSSHFLYPTHRDKTTIETIYRTTMALSRYPCPFGLNNPSNNHPLIQSSIHTSLATHNTGTFLYKLEGRSISGVSVFLFSLRHFRTFFSWRAKSHHDSSCTQRTTGIEGVIVKSL